MDESSEVLELPSRHLADAAADECRFSLAEKPVGTKLARRAKLPARVLARKSPIFDMGRRQRFSPRYSARVERISCRLPFPREMSRL